MSEDNKRGSVARHFSRRLQADLVVEGLLVGGVCGALICLYRMSLSWAERVLRSAIFLASGSPLGVAAFFVILTLLCLAVSWLVRWEPLTQGSGIPQVDLEVMGKLDMPLHRVLAAKFTEGTLCALGGLSLGREGPSVQLGAMCGKAVSRLLKRGRGEERLLTTCGAAAGMSAAFNAPLTGVLFAIEEIHREFSAPLIVSVMASSVAADLLMSRVLGVSPVLRLTFSKDLPHNSYLLVLLLGILCGVAGAVHNKLMFLMSERVYARIERGLPYSRFAVAFLASGICAFAFPQLLCGGDAIAELLIAPQKLGLLVLVGLLVGKYLLTTVCFGSGAPGGTLFPLCVMGMLLGAAFGSACVRLSGVPVFYLPNFIVLGICGLFASVVRAPVTAVVLAFELTGTLDALLSSSIVAIASYVIANQLRVDAFYEHLVTLQLGRTHGLELADEHLSEKVVHLHVIGAGSLLEGKRLSEVHWPGTSRVVTISRASAEIVPTGQTTLQALDEILVIMSACEEDRVQEDLREMSHARLANSEPQTGFRSLGAGHSPFVSADPHKGK
ncbi:ClC family H(+)/Cl(-) exchange transporter [Olsenella urininfantis]|uniref:ClC family H(+)/Cl(-) exchange transporter n=1 Tax=Olsenella urininfantis TaxID=1871033 RepID=UPI000986E247|nr:ClC family H(+)/Cl(-) exchange transporter [Olsenella urininfantis]